MVVSGDCSWLFSDLKRCIMYHFKNFFHRFGGDLVKWWSQETHDCASRILKSFLLDDSPNPSSLDQV